jgi:DNA repair exonuclease SbcCD ATPase subunit
LNESKNSKKKAPAGPRMSPEFEWTAQREQAAQLVADDRLSNDEIAAKVGVSAKQLERWKENLGFMQRVEEHVALWRERIRRHGLAVKERRINSLIADFNATEVILEERGKQLDGAADAAQDPYAGGARTGFITRDFKGKDADTPGYSFDAALMRERRELRRQIAQELGERLNVALPRVETPTAIVSAIGAVLAAVASGSITTSEGQALAGLLESQRRNLEVLQLEQRIAALEAAAGKPEGK